GGGPADDPFPGEPLLSAAELRALLGDPEPLPTNGDGMR
ncbi:MAG: hypothetical protein JWO31_3317, partial [Phycisphaerales bacterium]|nr:hypothetical protein [Phycisphaerales bacterium]